MSQTGSVWAGLLGLQTARFDLLEVYSSEQSKYLNVAIFNVELAHPGNPVSKKAIPGGRN